MNVGGLAHALTAFIRIYKVTRLNPEGAMVSKDVLVTMTNQMLTEIEFMVGDNEDVTITHS